MTKVLGSGISRRVLPMNEVRRTVLNVPSPQQLALPFYNQLPKDPVELLKWKLYVRERCLTDLEFRADIDEMCRQDVAFWAATFAWCQEPRPPRDIPMAPYCDQVDCLVWFKECLDTERDFGNEKTRGLFMSWTLALLVYWVLRYMPGAKIAYVTKDENTMDGPDSNSFLGKVAFLHEKMPAWMRLNAQGRDTMRRKMEQHIILFADVATTLQGFPPTNQNVRSLRFTLFINDEFAHFPRDAAQALAAAGFTTNCRGFVSTWFGRDNEFHRMMRVESSSMLRIESYWWNNWERYRGCYKMVGGRCEIIDKTYPFAELYPEGYPFGEPDIGEMIRSPWVDYELKRPGATLQAKLEEMYGLQAQDGRKLFAGDMLKIVGVTVRAPFSCGELVSSGREVKYKSKPRGLIKLWEELGDGVGGPFVAGCDIAFGRGKSYSTLELISLTTGRQVAEYADNEIAPVPFAQWVVDFLRWVNGWQGDGYTYLDFENNGDQGTAFANELDRLGYGNVRERPYKQIVGGSGKASFLGTKNRDGGMANFMEIERAIMNGELTVLSAEALAEMEHGDRDEDDCPVFHGPGTSNGDRVQGLALAWAFGRDKLMAAEEAISNIDPRAEIQKPIYGQRSSWASYWRKGA